MEAASDDTRLTVDYSPFHQGSSQVFKALEASRLGYR